MFTGGAISIFALAKLSFGATDVSQSKTWTPESEHPGFAHALEDLAFARAVLDGHGAGDEAYVVEIARAESEILAVASESRITSDVAPVDASLGRRARLERAIVALQHAHSDIVSAIHDGFAVSAAAFGLGPIESALRGLRFARFGRAEVR